MNRNLLATLLCAAALPAAAQQSAPATAQPAATPAKPAAAQQSAPATAQPAATTATTQPAATPAKSATAQQAAQPATTTATAQPATTPATAQPAAIPATTQYAARVEIHLVLPADAPPRTNALETVVLWTPPGATNYPAAVAAAFHERRVADPEGQGTLLPVRDGRHAAGIVDIPQRPAGLGKRDRTVWIHTLSDGRWVGCGMLENAPLSGTVTGMGASSRLAKHCHPANPPDFGTEVEMRLIEAEAAS